LSCRSEVNSLNFLSEAAVQNLHSTEKEKPFCQVALQFIFFLMLKQQQQQQQQNKNNNNKTNKQTNNNKQNKTKQNRKKNKPNQINQEFHPILNLQNDMQKEI